MFNFLSVLFRFCQSFILFAEKNSGGVKIKLVVESEKKNNSRDNERVKREKLGAFDMRARKSGVLNGLWGYDLRS